LTERGIGSVIGVPTAETCDPVGTREIAERLGVRQQTVAQWKLRGRLPPPRWSISGNPAWNWPTIAKWARETGRLTARDA
jgi:hypothetical protein